jgi:alpha-L-rhamnosidase
VVTFLHRYTAGLRMTSPGYRTFTVAPRPGGDLSWARARLDCPHGTIEVDWAVEGGAFRLAVDVPAGTTATVVLPDSTVHEAPPGRHCWQSPLTR